MLHITVHALKYFSQNVRLTHVLETYINLYVLQNARFMYMYVI